MNLNQLIDAFRDNGCKKLYAKNLSENDNSKNQIYLGSDFKAINLIPYQTIDTGAKNYKAKIDLFWMDEDSSIHKAPKSQLILYPQYPEIRLSGFLFGCKNAPSKTMNRRLKDRLLFLGIKNNKSIVGFVVKKDHPITKEFNNLPTIEQTGIFYNLSAKLLKKDSKVELLNGLKRIHNSKWIDSKRLNSQGNILNCNAPNCGGYTLEAELNIPPNSLSEPDFLGWEVKQHGVSAFDRFESGVLTLMTPEPSGGYYKEKGVIDFVKKYGYKDLKGKKGRMNFGGIHRYNEFHHRTNLCLTFEGYDNEKNKIQKMDGGIVLLSKTDRIVAKWYFDGLLSHWNRKHAQAVYVPSMKRKAPNLQYHYGNLVRLGEETDFLLFLKAFTENKVYYDPGIKVEKVKNMRPKTKRRSQFRIKSSDIHSLYNKMTLVDLMKKLRSSQTV